MAETLPKVYGIEELDTKWVRGPFDLLPDCSPEVKWERINSWGSPEWVEFKLVKETTPVWLRPINGLDPRVFQPEPNVQAQALFGYSKTNDFHVSPEQYQAKINDLTNQLRAERAVGKDYAETEKLYDETIKEKDTKIKKLEARISILNKSIVELTPAYESIKEYTKWERDYEINELKQGQKWLWLVWGVLAIGVIGGAVFGWLGIGR